MVHFFVFNIFFGSFFYYFIKSNFKIFQSQMNNLWKKVILKKDTKNILKTKKCAILKLLKMMLKNQTFDFYVLHKYICRILHVACGQVNVKNNLKVQLY
jgi:hypothetical protein